MSHFHNWLDRNLPPEIILGRTAVPTFLICGLFGMAAGSMAVVTLVAVRGASLWVAMGMVGVESAAFVAMGLLHQSLLGWEEHVHLRDTYVVFSVVALLLWATGNPILSYLDALAIGMSVFMVFGRIGCTAAGCCYGVGASVGIRYPRHACCDAEQIRRFPVQPIEAVLWVGVAAAGTLVFLFGSPGQAVGVTLVLCGITRIGTDVLRRDERPHWWGISETRLLSLVGIGAGAALYQQPANWGVNDLMFGIIGLLMGGLVYFGRHRWLVLPDPLPEDLPQRASGIGRAIVSLMSTRLPVAAPVPEVQTFTIDDIRIGVSFEPAGSIIHLVLSVSRSNADMPLSAVEAEYVLGLVARAVGVDPEAMPPLIAGERGVFLVQVTRANPFTAAWEDDLEHDIPPDSPAPAPSPGEDGRAVRSGNGGSSRPASPFEPTDDYFTPSPPASDGEPDVR